MYTDFFKTLIEQNEKALSPMTQYNKMLVKSIEETTRLQLAAMQVYSETGVKQMKGASSVTDVQSWFNFNVKQVEAITELSSQMIEDGEKLSKIGQEFKTELDAMASETVKKATAKV
ncbi:phasin family protein [Shewanella psychrophila]|uniref:Phasin family protein n=1 Tax=Shewanella psychrophila TaxID=225848 RepID=A0A1S6HRP4_9GAMM|nr:phasin family protein [Shewanella psychrophila]AQS38193.1 phasin family protein [Shewanella psychrophila]